jgi:hypothetical protein
MGAGLSGLVAGLLGVLLLASPLGVALAQVREEGAEEFNARARAQEGAYMRQWEAEQAALTSQSSGNAYPNDAVARAEAQSGEALSPTADETAGLRCLNENRASVELPPVTLHEFREGRAAGTIATAENLCGRDYVGDNVQQADAGPAAALETPPDQAAANEHFTRAAAWGDLQEQINLVGLLILAALLYFIPAIIAFRRRHHYRWPIFAFNLGAAWTGLGWIGTLVWALWPAQSAIIDPVISDATGIDRS